jgi:hypothetical protein
MKRYIVLKFAEARFLTCVSSKPFYIEAIVSLEELILIPSAQGRESPRTSSAVLGYLA